MILVFTWIYKALHSLSKDQPTSHLWIYHFSGLKIVYCLQIQRPYILQGTANNCKFLMRRSNDSTSHLMQKKWLGTPVHLLSSKVITHSLLPILSPGPYYDRVHLRILKEAMEQLSLSYVRFMQVFGRKFLLNRL